MAMNFEELTIFKLNNLYFGPNWDEFGYDRPTEDCRLKCKNVCIFLKDTFDIDPKSFLPDKSKNTGILIRYILGNHNMYVHVTNSLKVMVMVINVKRQMNRGNIVLKGESISLTEEDIELLSDIGLTAVTADRREKFLVSMKHNKVVE